MTYKQRILAYLLSIAPDRATNREIRAATGVRSHQQVYLLTQELFARGVIDRSRADREWSFWWKCDDDRTALPDGPGEDEQSPGNAGHPVPSAFESLARCVMAIELETKLPVGSVPAVPKQFDMVSQDGSIVGDAMYCTVVYGKGRPSAMFATIAEHVWLLEKTGAKTKFVVFGNDRRVPETWLATYGALAGDIRFYFLSDGGELSPLLP